MALGLLLSPAILRALRTPEEVLPQALVYLRIYLLSIPMVIFYNMVTGGMRTYGDTRTPFLILVVCGVLNVGLDALFIVVIPMGVAGVAIATCITQSLSAVLVGWFASRPGIPLRLEWKKLRMDWRVLRTVLFLGLPTGIQTIIITFSNIMVQYYINDFGAAAVAAFATYYKVENFIYLPIMAFGQAATTFAGQNTGAGHFRRLRNGTLVTAAIGSAVVACLAGTVLFNAHTVYSWFIRDPEVVAVTVTIAMVSFPFYWIYPILEVIGGAVRGMGCTLHSMTVIILNMCVLRISLLAVFSRTFHTIRSLAAVYPITWAGAAICFIALFAFIISRKTKQESLDSM